MKYQWLFFMSSFLFLINCSNDIDKRGFDTVQKLVKTNLRADYDENITRGKIDEKIYKRALKFEDEQRYKTAQYAFELIINKYPQSKYVNDAKKHLFSIKQKESKKSSFNVAPIAIDQRFTTSGGRRVRTAIEAGLKIGSQDRSEIERLIMDLRRSLDFQQNESLPVSSYQGGNRPSPKIIEIIYPPVAVVNQPVYIRVVAQNNGKLARQGGITISFPDKQDYLSVFQVERSKTDLKVYREGDKLYSDARKAVINAIHPVVETYSWSSIKSDESYSLTVFVEPSTTGILRFYVRTALRGEGNNFYGYPSGSNFTLDQQDWPVIECAILVEESEFF